MQKKQKIKNKKQKQKQKQNLKQRLKQNKKIKTFDEYYQECIKNKTILKDIPHYLKKALERAIKEYEKGIILEKSGLANFSEKYTILGKSGILPMEYFEEKAPQIKDFLEKYQKTKVKMLMVCKMVKDEGFVNSYFHSKTYINLENTNVEVILEEMEKEILDNISIYLKNGSEWNFSEVESLEIHIVEYKPMKGGSYIPLPEFIMRKKINN